MKNASVFALLTFSIPPTVFSQQAILPDTDLGYIENGNELPRKTYPDQTYIIVCNDGSWLCSMTTSSGIEGSYVNHIMSTKSYEKGKTRTKLDILEPPGISQSSWAVHKKIPGGLIYVFNNCSQYRFKGLEGVMSGPISYRYSDDHCKTWSEKVYEVP